MRYLRTFLTLALIMLISACAENLPIKENTPVKKESPNTFDPKSLSGKWWKASSLSNNDEQWSRKKPTVPQRFYRTMNFQLPSQFGTTVLHPTDRHYSVVGSFSVQGNTVNAEYRLASGQNETAARRNKLIQTRFTVIKINNDEMVLRPIPIPTVSKAVTIEKSRLVGAWRAGKSTANSNGVNVHLLTPCNEQSSENPCHLILQANGEALIRDNVPKTLTAIPSNEPQKFSVKAGTWTLQAENRLVVNTNETPKNTAVLELSPAGSGFKSGVNYSTLYW